MNKLNLETFNDILFGALKDQSVEGQIKLLKAELNMIGDMLFSETAELLDELEQCGYESERFTRIKNIKSNSEGLLLKLEGLEQKLKAGGKNEWFIHFKYAISCIEEYENNGNTYFVNGNVSCRISVGNKGCIRAILRR